MSFNLDEAGMPVGHAIDPAWEVTPRTAAERFARKEVRLIDCRTEPEREIASIEGALFAPIHQLSSHIEQLREFEEEELIVFCHHGVRSRQMVAALREEGFEQVYSMAGGIDLWSHAVDESTPTY